MKLGGQCFSLPAFKWIHRFQRPGGQPYPAEFTDRIYNYFIGCFELGEDPNRAIDYFRIRYADWELEIIFREAKETFLKHSQGRDRDLRISGKSA